MASGHIADMPAVAGATHVWQSGSRVRELNAAWPFVRYTALAEAHERGEAVEFTWQRFHENPRQAPFTGVSMSFSDSSVTGRRSPSCPDWGPVRGRRFCPLSRCCATWQAGPAPGGAVGRRLMVDETAQP